MSKKPSILLAESAIPFDKACTLVRVLERENELMRMTLREITKNIRSVCDSESRILTLAEQEILDSLKKLNLYDIYL